MKGKIMYNNKEKSTCNKCCKCFFIGGNNKIRTCDPLLVRQVL